MSIFSPNRKKKGEEGEKVHGAEPIIPKMEKEFFFLSKGGKKEKTRPSKTTSSSLKRVKRKGVLR